MSNFARPQQKYVAVVGRDLPKQPLPGLVILQKLPDMVSTFVSDEGLDDFSRQLGQAARSKWMSILYDRLRCFSVDRHDWFSTIWYRDVYDSYKGPLKDLVYSIGLPSLMEGAESMRQLAALVRGVYDEHEAYRQGGISQSIRGGKPLCMHQYDFFPVSRLPTQEGPDEITVHNDSTHCVVMRRGHVFRVELCDVSGVPRSVSAIHAELVEIQHFPLTEEGMISTVAIGDRATCARVRVGLEPVDAASVHCVDTSLFVVCVDEPSSHNPVWDSLFSVNNWPEKQVLHMSSEGCFSLVYEHSRCFGTTGTERALRMVDYARRCLCEAGASHDDVDAISVSPLAFSGQSEGVLRQIKEVHQRDVSPVTTEVWVSPFTKDEIKEKCRMAPDTFVQLSFNLALAMLHQNGSVYEAVCLREFYHGLTGVARTNLDPVRVFCEAVMQGDAFSKTFLDAAVVAINDQKAQAKAGNAPERLLKCLRHFLEERDQFFSEAQAFFSHPALVALGQDKLSTSNLNGVSHFGFIPPSLEGYGVGYSLEPGFMIFTVSQYQAAPPFLPQLETATRLLLSALSSERVYG